MPNGSVSYTHLFHLFSEPEATLYKPTKGKIEKQGVTAPLLELGAGFDGNYSGRENIFLYGAILRSVGQLLDIMDYISNSVMMPFIALLSTILIGWVVTPDYVISEMERSGDKLDVYKRQLYDHLLPAQLHPGILRRNHTSAL